MRDVLTTVYIHRHYYSEIYVLKPIDILVFVINNSESKYIMHVLHILKNIHTQCVCITHIYVYEYIYTKYVYILSDFRFAPGFL